MSFFKPPKDTEPLSRTLQAFKRNLETKTVEVDKPSILLQGNKQRRLKINIDNSDDSKKINLSLKDKFAEIS